MAHLDLCESLARQLRADSIRCSTAAGSGHPTSSLSAADLMAVLLLGHLRYDWSLIVAVFIPETAGRSLEEISPERTPG
jgi:transketolase N-terminal domain/subunit